ncbi:MAG: hypothetical protein IT373_12915 [Polyangiaceae bacterium]|nr:hypothetical protein [Polyangiaceae bacterium]
MPKPNPKVLLRTAAAYLKTHPEEIARAVKGAFGLRFGLPLDALRYMVREFAQGPKAPQDVLIEAAPPGLRLGATVKQMGTTMRATLVLFVEELHVTTEQARITLRIADMKLEVLDGKDTPLAGLILSGALDLSKPGNLVAYMPKRPDMLVEAKDDRVTIDLMKVPKLAGNAKVRRWIGVITPVLGVRAVSTRDDHLDVSLRASPSGIAEALAAARTP